MMVILILLFIACTNQYEISTFDVSAAFLEGTNDVIQYAWIPTELCTNNNSTRVKVIGNWYGKKQGPKIWYDKFDSIIKLMNFTRCPVMPCLCYYKDKTNNTIIIITIHVDDGRLVTSNSAVASNNFMTDLMKAKLSEVFKRYLGIVFQRTSTSLTVTQCKYIDEIDIIDIIDVEYNESTKSSS